MRLYARKSPGFPSVIQNFAFPGKGSLRCAMEEETHQLHHQSHACPVRGMECVVATVSGYHGSERFNLIKLISHAGANYVGAMSKSITHLICWKFEGRKYNLAQKFRTIIVNHRWVEDCIKEGRRVPEDSYILQSGYEVGPLLLEVPLAIQASSLTKNKVISDGLYDVGSKKQTIELSSGASESFVWEDFCLMNKNLFFNAGEIANIPHKTKQKVSEKDLKQSKHSNGGDCSHEIPFSRLRNVEHEESSSYYSRQSRKEKRNICDSNGLSVVAGRSRKGRRLVKNIVDEEVLDPLLLDLSPEDHLSRMHRLQTDAAATSSDSSVVHNENILENREGPDSGLYNQSGTINGASDGIEQIKDSINIATSRNSSLFVEEPSPMVQTSIDVCSSAEKFTHGGQVDNVAVLPTSKELSCVICFTDFSSTRGILPCGHRFCFPCIQSWVDHRTSMGKNSTCPLCKASFVMIKKIEHAATADQKVYSQTIPCDNSASVIFIPADQVLTNYGFEAGACVVCRGREPEDLLESCNVCRTRRIHSYCLDPPLRPWTCSHCKELRMHYHNHSH